MLEDKIKHISQELFPFLIETRAHFHKHPELSGVEFETSNYISTILKKYKIEHTREWANTGIVGLIYGNKKNSSKVVGLRADMDALPIQETNDVDYKSLNSGIMHACGHDVHMTCLIGAAIILNELKNEFGGCVKLIFQPSEETFPGGAIQMIEQGVLSNPKPDIMIAQHVLPQLKAGEIGFKGGFYMASTDEIYLTVKGKGGHAATPDENIDPILISSHLIVALQQIVSRKAPPYIPTVLSFGRIIGEGRTNIIPNEVKIDGTLRTLDENWRIRAHEIISKISHELTQSMGATCSVVIKKGYPALFNNQDLTNRLSNYANNFLGNKNVKTLDLRMTAEDFAYFAQNVPSCMYRLGVSNIENNIQSNLHTSTFNIDEQALLTGTSFLVYSCLKELN